MKNATELVFILDKIGSTALLDAVGLTIQKLVSVQKNTVE